MPPLTPTSGSAPRCHLEELSSPVATDEPFVFKTAPYFELPSNLLKYQKSPVTPSRKVDVGIQVDADYDSCHRVRRHTFQECSHIGHLRPLPARDPDHINTPTDATLRVDLKEPCRVHPSWHLARLLCIFCRHPRESWHSFRRLAQRRRRAQYGHPATDAVQSIRLASRAHQRRMQLSIAYRPQELCCCVVRSPSSCSQVKRSIELMWVSEWVVS